MRTDPPAPGRAAPRIGLVLGAGGTLGAAWTIGALAIVQDRIGRPLQDVDVIVGTSAGSVVATALRCGLTPETLIAHQRGDHSPGLVTPDELAAASGHRPTLPRLRIGSVRLLAAAAQAPHRIHPNVAASALVPQGRTAHHTLHRFVGDLVNHRVPDGAGRPRFRPQESGDHWPDRPTWIVSVDYASGRRAVFGRSGGPVASLPDAVVASCSIPGWHVPKRIAGRDYVDGGVRSVASADLLRTAGLDEVYVLAPMASHDVDRPRHAAGRTERFVRQMFARAVDREVRKVEAGGTRVVVLMPGPEDLAAIGANLMDPRRRRAVLETSLRTAPGHLAATERDDRRAVA
jgi:NTE family protein